jgi:hypothetical protein
MPTPTLATYSFLPWLRRGLASQIERRDGETSPDIHVRVPLGLTLNNNLSVTVPLALKGPGEVGAIDKDVIARVYPARNAFDVESNYFPLLEFEQPDLPWRYTPARADTASRLRPWVCLVTLTDDEIESFVGQAAEGALDVLTVKNGASLPDLAQSWAWAHVQVSGEDAADLDAGALNELLTHHHQRVVGRLLSPRRLIPKTTYTTFLVPTFERGRLAGLGEAPQGDGLTPAWGAESASIRLPVFYHWRFGTGIAGDFEYLVRLLEARPLPEGVGTRPIEVSAPGLGLPPAADAALALEGALVPPGFSRPAWSGTTPQIFRDELTLILDASAARLEQTNQLRIVGPPLYGRWHAKREKMATQPPWFGTLNIDPRNRTLAGIGTQVIQSLQRQLMASAWEQVAGIREANERLRFAQLARAAAERVFERHVKAQETEVVLGLTSPLHAKVKASPTTIAERLRTSPVAPGALAPQLRRIARARGPLGRRLGFAPRGTPTRIVGKLNRGDLEIATPPEVPAGAITPKDSVVPAPGDTPAQRAARRRKVWWLRIAALLLIILALLLLIFGAWSFAIALASMAVGAYLRARAIEASVAKSERIDDFASGKLTPGAVAAAPLPDSFVPGESAPDGSIPPASPPGSTPSAGERAAAARFRTAAVELFGEVSTPPLELPPLVSVPLTQFQATLSISLEPRTTFAASIQGRLNLAPAVAVQPGADPLEPVMAAPIFPQPMYKPLSDLSRDWLLPGLEKIPQNTSTLLESNQAVIEGYMVGLSHEMARELQWNEYPTDMRGTYFRQFWDVASYAGDVPADKLLDIRQIHGWQTTQLGANTARDLPPSGRHLVLLIRGELLRRYPNTVVYAVKTVRTAKGRELGTEERHPLFRGTLEPDVTFLGFDLTAAEVTGVEDPQSPDQGWYFVLQEQPSEPRFGLDVPSGTLGGVATTWSDLSWSHLAATDEELQSLANIDLDANLPDTRQVAQSGGAAWHASSGLGAAGATAAHLAYITLQQPMRVALHGSDMVRT